MHKSLYILTATGLLGSFLAAQAGPGRYTQAQKHPYLNVVELAKITSPQPLYPSGTGNIQQVHTNKALYGLKAGQYAMSMTMGSLDPYYTGRAAAATGVLVGRYDKTGTNPVFTPLDIAKTLNPQSGTAFGLMIEGKEGKVATVDWTSGPMVAYRDSIWDTTTNTDVPFGTALPIPTVPTPWIDPAPAYVDGVLHVVYVSTNGIEMRPLNLTIQSGALTAVAVGPQTLISTLSGSIVHSPTPVLDAAGDMNGLFMAARVGNDSDMYYQGSLLSSDTPMLMADDTAWMNNGGVMGSEFVFAMSGTSYAELWTMQATHMQGSETAIGGTATITASGPSVPGLRVFSTTLAAGINTSTAIPVPGINGNYALGATVLIFGSISGSDADELAHWSAPVPNNSTLKGLSVPLQGLTNPVSPTLGPGFTNTTQLRIK